uniref:Integrase catalytic domain-containing protein n=1 Tax=Molossus molossus TaxID=27622 RepID=A0A7J8FRW9_MOLMO|nr:hypothetical protein HJG59_008342 [Molossus molossus]
MGIDGLPTTPKQMALLNCIFEGHPFSHSFLVMPACPVPLLGRDILSKLHTTISFLPQQLHLIALLSGPTQATASASAVQLLPAVHPGVWDTNTPSVASHHAPILIKLKNPSSYPNRPQFPISQAHRLGLHPIISKLRSQGLLIPTNSPCNSLILPVKKPSGQYRLVQDLRIINSAVMPISPVVPNLLSHIPPHTTHFSVLDLKDAFFTIPLHPDSYFLFAFTWEDPVSNISQQLTWTVLPQGFRDSPHLFGQAHAQDLRECDLSPSTLLQYVDDLLICSPSEGDSISATTALLNFLYTKGYRVSAQKAQIATPSVTYLGLLVTPTHRAITSDRLQALRDLQPPTSAMEIQSFLGLMGFFRHWIPNFALLARPLYQAARDTPEGPLTSPKEVRQAFQTLLEALCSASALALPNPQRPFLLYTDEKHHLAIGVLVQPLGPTLVPVAYLSKQLDPTVHGWQPCLRALAAAAAELTTEALKINLQQPLQVFSPHRLTDLLILPDAQRLQILSKIHKSLHIGPDALHRFLSPILHPDKLRPAIQAAHASCSVCSRSNSQGACHVRRPLHQMRGHLPGQNWQIDFTHIPKHKQLKYLLTVVDTFSGWIEALPTASETAETVATHLLKDIIPRFGLPNSIQSDNGPAFISKVTEAVSVSLGIKWKLHVAQSSGKVERANGLIKEQLTKLSLELRQSWPDLLPLALTRLRATPRGPSHLSPFELLYGRPFLLPTPSIDSPPPLASYLPYLSLLCSLLREHANRTLPKPGPDLGSELSQPISPGDWVLIKTLSPRPLHPKWEGPYTVVLTTPSAVKVLGISAWIHLSGIKKAPIPEEQPVPEPRFTCTPLGPTKIRIYKTP